MNRVSPGRAGQPCLTDSQINLVASWARYCSNRLGYPQDIEWAFVGNQLFVLQSRPITSKLDGETYPYFYYWEQRDLDSWPGVTTPMTFSFIRRFYANKFRHLARSMGVPTRRISEEEGLYFRMIGLIQGRIYLNISTIEKIWAGVPGFQRYRHVFNDWIGINDTPNMPPAPQLPFPQLMREHWDILLNLSRIAWRYRKWDQEVAEYFTDVRNMLARCSLDLELLNPDRLVQLYVDLEAALYRQWSKPTLNNFFASFFYRRLGKLTSTWCGDTDFTLRNNLICGEGGIYSAEPLRYLEKLARLAMRSPQLVQMLCEGEASLLTEAAGQVPEFHYHVRRYLLAYGQRCHESLKFESPNIADDPILLLKTIGYYARRLAQTEATYAADTESSNLHFDQLDQPNARELKIREEAEAVVAEQLEGHPIRQKIFDWVLRNARARNKDRENIRFVQTQVQGMARRLMRNLGRCYTELGLLDNPTDIYYLEVEEALGFVESTTSCADLRGLAALRKEEFQRYEAASDPPACFETLGSSHFNRITTIYQGMDAVRITDDTEDNPTLSFDSQNSLFGISCSPGVSRGPVYIVSRDKTVNLQGGEILIAEQGDPGLVMLFPSAAGLLFEKGSPLSHLSIVAREMGIPTIVSITGLSQWLSDGDWVEMDGNTGQIRKLDPVIDFECDTERFIRQS